MERYLFINELPVILTRPGLLRMNPPATPPPKPAGDTGTPLPNIEDAPDAAAPEAPAPTDEAAETPTATPAAAEGAEEPPDKTEAERAAKGDKGPDTGTTTAEAEPELPPEPPKSLQDQAHEYEMAAPTRAQNMSMVEVPPFKDGKLQGFSAWPRGTDGPKGVTQASARQAAKTLRGQKKKFTEAEQKLKKQYKAEQKHGKTIADSGDTEAIKASEARLHTTETNLETLRAAEQDLDVKIKQMGDFAKEKGKVDRKRARSAKRDRAAGLQDALNEPRAGTQTAGSTDAPAAGGGVRMGKQSGWDTLRQVGSGLNEGLGFLGGTATNAGRAMGGANFAKESAHELFGSHGQHGMFGPGGIGRGTGGYGSYGGFPAGYGVYNQGFNGYGGYGGFSGGQNGAMGGYAGGFNLAMGGFGMNYGMNDTREQDRRLSMIINMLLFAVAAGNTDAISTALTMIARKGKESLRRVATSALVALQSYEREQSKISDAMGNLNPEDKGYTGDLSQLQSDMGRYSSNRQMIVSLLRDVKSMVDELENMSKSYQDTSLQHQRRQMIFA